MLGLGCWTNIDLRLNRDPGNGARVRNIRRPPSPSLRSAANLAHVGVAAQTPPLLASGFSADSEPLRLRLLSDCFTRATSRKRVSRPPRNSAALRRDPQGAQTKGGVKTVTSGSLRTVTHT